MIAVDASVWVSGLTPRDVFHDTSRHWLEVQLTQDVSLAIPVICLALITWAMATRNLSALVRRITLVLTILFASLFLDATYSC